MTICAMRIARRTQISNFMKIGPVGAEFVPADRRRGEQTDRQTDRHDEPNIANAPTFVQNDSNDFSS